MDPSLEQQAYIFKIWKIFTAYLEYELSNLMFSLFVSTIKEKNARSDFLLIIRGQINFSGQINNTQS